MPFCSYSISSGHSIRNLISSSVALPRNRRFSTALCHWSGGMGYRGLGYFRSRSLDSMACSRPRIAVGRCSLPRCGYGFGVAGTGFGYRGAGFGYKVGGVSRSCTITPITINEQLLQPLRLEIDPNIQTVKNQEKEQIKTLNNKFVSFIDKVRFLEQQNKVLETKWSFLQGQKHHKNTITPMLETSIGNLKKQLEALRHNRVQLETELKAAQKVLETNKNMYEDKCSQRTSTESEFIALKKDAECFFSNKAELDAKVKSLKEEIEFLRTFYEEEIHQLQAHISDTTAVVQVHKSRDLNLDGITVDVKARYEDIARKSRAEAQALYESKLEELQAIAGRNANSLRETKTKIAELTQLAQRLNREVRSTKDQRCKLEAAAANAEQTGETAIKDAKHKLSELETALQQTKADLTQQLHEYQDLMHIKLALDVEIFTYRKLLEGEESRLCPEEGFPVSIPVYHSHGSLSYGPEPGFARIPVSAKRNPCWTSSMVVCGPVVSCSSGVSSRNTRSSHMKVASRTKSARSNI